MLLGSTQNQRYFNDKFRRWFNVDKTTLFECWNIVIYSTDDLLLKGNAQFIFLCYPQNSGALWVWITFLQITQKILTKDIFHWLELITEILSFLQIFSVRKTTSQFFWYLETLPEYQEKKSIFLAYFGPLKANYK